MSDTPSPNQAREEAVARAIYDEMEGPVANQDAARQMRQWQLAQRLAKVALTAAPPAGGGVDAPVGWKLVPIEPGELQIEAMRDAFRQARRGGICGMTIAAQWRCENAPELAAYSAALTAAPTPTAPSVTPSGASVEAVKEIILEAMGDLRADIHGDIDGTDQAADWAAAKITALSAPKSRFPFAWAWQDDDLVWQATCDEDRAHHSARVKGYEVVDLYRAASPTPAPTQGDGAETEQTFDEGIDFALGQLCAFLNVDQTAVTWDAATETLDGDVRSVIGNILRAKFGEDWSPAAPSPSPASAPSPADAKTLAATQELLDKALNVLGRCHTVLFNMAKENEGAIFNRWPIHHEPLRSDARNLLPLIDEVLGHD